MVIKPAAIFATEAVRAARLVHLVAHARHEVRTAHLVVVARNEGPLVMEALLLGLADLFFNVRRQISDRWLVFERETAHARHRSAHGGCDFSALGAAEWMRPHSGSTGWPRALLAQRLLAAHTNVGGRSTLGARSLGLSEKGTIN